MLSQIWGTRFAEREVSGVFFWKTQGKKVKGITQQVQTWGACRSCTCWMVELKSPAVGTLAIRGDATQNLPPAAEAKIANLVHLISNSCQHGTAMHCWRGEFPDGNCSSWPGGQPIAKAFHLNGLMFKCGWLRPRFLALNQHPGLLKGLQAIIAKTHFPAVSS